MCQYDEKFFKKYQMGVKKVACAADFELVE
jgi:hypothetical protein